MVFCVFVQVRKKLKHVEEERLRRHNEAVSSPLILFHGNMSKFYSGFCMAFVFLNLNGNEYNFSVITVNWVYFAYE